MDNLTKTAHEILSSNDKTQAGLLLEECKKVAKANPEEHARLLGYPYNKGGFEEDKTNGIRRIMVELKVLSIWGKHTCPKILIQSIKPKTHHR